MVKISIIIPVLNEENSIHQFLDQLQWLRNAGHELIVVDGGSTDNTLKFAQGCYDLLLHSAKGRAKQMNAGAAAASGDTLLFLHADTSLPSAADMLIGNALSTHNKVWGRFDVRLTGGSLLFRMIERLMNMRSRITGIATGDQAMFVKAAPFSQLGGFEEIPLMEDVSLSKRLKRFSPPVCLCEKVVTSSRRWEENGIWKTIILMWQLRLAYFLGEDPHTLVNKYYR